VVNIEAKKAFENTYRNPSMSSLEILIEKFSDIPSMYPDFSSNTNFQEFTIKLPYELEALNEDEIKEFMDTKMRIYFCVFDMNLSAIKMMMDDTVVEDELEKNPSHGFSSLDSICFD